MGGDTWFFQNNMPHDVRQRMAIRVRSQWLANASLVMMWVCPFWTAASHTPGVNMGRHTISAQRKGGVVGSFFRGGDGWGVGLAHINLGQTYVAMPLTYQVTLRGSEQIIKLFILKMDQQCYRKVCRNSGDMYMTGNR